MLPARFWNRDGGTLLASHSFDIRLSLSPVSTCPSWMPSGFSVPNISYLKPGSPKPGSSEPLVRRGTLSKVGLMGEEGSSIA